MGCKAVVHFGIWCLVLLCFPVFCPGVEAVRPADGTGEEPNPGAWLAALFRDHLSAVDGDRCPSYPSCSSFSVSAFKKHGFFVGWILTVDRLFHEGREEADVSPVVYHQGRPKIFDPVENNDFWWYPRVPQAAR